MATTTVFGSPTAIGAKILTINTTITNTNGSYTNTIQDDRLTASMKAIKLELGNPAAFDAVINVVVNNGYLTINCASVTGTSTAIISIIKVTEDPTAITSTEFDILANRISHMTTLFEVTLDSVTNTSGSYTHTTTVAGMTSDLKCVKLECSDPTIFRDTVDITSGSDSVTLTCSNVVGSSTVKASFLSVGNGNPLSSMEYNALDTRIGALSDLDTTDKTDIVSAINEADGKTGNIENYKTKLITLPVNLSSSSAWTDWGSLKSIAVHFSISVPGTIKHAFATYVNTYGSSTAHGNSWICVETINSTDVWIAFLRANVGNVTGTVSILVLYEES